MRKYTLGDVKNKVDELALKINAPDTMLPAYGNTNTWETSTFIEIDHQGWMYYVVSERGTRHEKLATDLDDLLYQVFQSITFFMALDYELKNRIENKDYRRIIFNKQEELLGALNGKWQHKRIEEHTRILFSAPFDDLASPRATYWGQLRAQGYSNAEIEKLAYEKYPKNV